MDHAQTSHIRKISFKPDSTGPQKPTHRTTSTPFTGSQVNASIKAAYLTRSSIPSAAQLAVSQPFGKNTKNVSVTTTPTIYSTLLIVIMNRCTYLKNDDYEALWSMDPRVKHSAEKLSNYPQWILAHSQPVTQTGPPNKPFHLIAPK